MESKTIKELLNRYFDGLTSLAEEQQLRRYFASEQVDEELRPYQQLFAPLDELSQLQQLPQELELELSRMIDETVNETVDKLPKARVHKRWSWSLAAAAVIAAVLLLTNKPSNEYNWADTYDDPQIAYAEANKTLQLVAEKYQLGLNQLQPVQKVNRAVSPLDKGLKKLNHGFQQMESLNNSTKKFQNE